MEASKKEGEISFPKCISALTREVRIDPRENKITCVAKNIIEGTFLRSSCHLEKGFYWINSDQSIETGENIPYERKNVHWSINIETIEDSQMDLIEVHENFTSKCAWKTVFHQKF